MGVSVDIDVDVCIVDVCFEVVEGFALVDCVVDSTGSSVDSGGSVVVCVVSAVITSSVVIFIVLEL